MEENFEMDEDTVISPLDKFHQFYQRLLAIGFSSYDLYDEEDEGKENYPPERDERVIRPNGEGNMEIERERLQAEESAVKRMTTKVLRELIAQRGEVQVVKIE